VYFNPVGSHRVSLARLQDSTSYIQQHSADRQVPALHVHHEHSHHSHHCHHYQLELPHATYAPHTALGQSRLPPIPSTNSRHYQAQVLKFAYFHIFLQIPVPEDCVVYCPQYIAMSKALE